MVEVVRAKVRVAAAMGGAARVKVLVAAALRGEGWRPRV